jgi:hypothetical protein
MLRRPPDLAVAEIIKTVPKIENTAIIVAIFTAHGWVDLVARSSDQEYFPGWDLLCKTGTSVFGRSI